MARASQNSHHTTGKEWVPAKTHKHPGALRVGKSRNNAEIHDYRISFFVVMDLPRQVCGNTHNFQLHSFPWNVLEVLLPKIIEETVRKSRFLKAIMIVL